MDTRQAIQQALAYAYLGDTNTANFQTYGCPIDNSPGSQGYQIAMSVQSAKIRGAVNGQPPHISDWLNFCYAPDVEAIHKPVKQAHVASVVASTAFTGPYSIKRAGKIGTLLYLAVEDYRVGMIMGRELPVASYLEGMGISGAHWSRDWEPIRRAALMKIKGFDQEGVSTVSIVLRAILEAERE
jgi:hypothetical protein